jgi:hypothetical protein
MHWDSKILLHCPPQERPLLLQRHISIAEGEKFLFLVMVTILDWGRGYRTQFLKGAIQGPFQQSLV